MSGNKQIREMAKRLLQLSVKDEEVVPEQVTAVLEALSKHPPRYYKAVLRAYLQLVRRQIERNQAHVEYAGELSADLIRSIEASLSAHYGRPITAVATENKDLIAGWRIRVESDLYDASIASRLEQLAKATAAR